mmetsp:Transcript_28831/g.60877  ORF Transcript_28831/g.60877 Transcript_28831/m.60877 type:complete len:287 (+) Transcript_28831:2-862(+)
MAANKSKETCFPIVYGTCLNNIGGSPFWKGDRTPSSFNNFGSPSNSPLPKVGSVTKRIRVSSMGHRIIAAKAPAHTADARYASLLLPSENKERNVGLRDSYTPNFRAPSMPYPTTVGPSPAVSAFGPSSSMIFSAASDGEIFASAESLCILVLTTSIGVVIPCDMAALAPPAMKNLGSADFFFVSSFCEDSSTNLFGGGLDTESSPSEMEGVVIDADVSDVASFDSAKAKSFGVVANKERNIIDDVATEFLRNARLSEATVMIESSATILSWRRVIGNGSAHFAAV